MPKLWNKLYSDPDKARSHEAGTEVFITQPIKAFGKKFGVCAHSPSAIYFNMALKSEQKATSMLKEIQKKVHQSDHDLYIVDDELFVPFLNEVLNLIVWGYASIEAMANAHIEAKNVNALRETLREKLQVVLPKECGKKMLPKKLFNRFKWIEEVRDKIIHPKKVDYYDASKWENCIFYDFGNYPLTTSSVSDSI